MYSLRLDSAEVAALEVQAAARGLKPSVLARNLIRVGLRPQHDDALGAAVSRVHDALAEVSGLLGR